MNQTADGAPDDDDFGNDLDMIDASTCANDYEALESGDEPEADNIDRPEMVCFSYVYSYVMPIVCY